MIKHRRTKVKSDRQQLDIKLALALGLPTACPLLKIDDPNGNEVCVETREILEDSALCQLDTATGCDYRLCEAFAQWFWVQAAKQEVASTTLTIEEASK